MKSKSLIGLLTAVTLSLTLSLAPRVNAQDDGAGADRGKAEKYALLIGINDYPRAPLSGCENDIVDFDVVLQKKYGFSRDNILKLFSKEATRDGIINAFKSHLIENAKKRPNAIYVFHYSGHGSQSEDMDGDEEDKLDETICPVDTRIGNKYDITDDELAELFDELQKYTPNITFILDSCHSGTGTRAPNENARVRSLPPDTRKYPARRGGVSERILAKSKKYVTISGCRNYETSREHTYIIDGKPRQNGLLTASLIEVLNQAPAGMTYRQLWERAAQAVTDAEFGQHPQIEGDLDRVVFGGVKDRSDPFVKVKGVENGEVTIEAGTVHGVQPDATIAFYKADAIKLTGPNKVIALGTVKNADSFESRVSVRPDVSADELKTAKAVVATPYFGAKKVRVQLDSSAQNVLAKGYDAFARDIETGVKQSRLLEFVGARNNPLSNPERSWDLAVCHGKLKDFLAWRKASTSQILKATDNSDLLFITDSDGYPIFDFYVKASDPQAATKLVDALQKKATVEKLRALTNGTSDLDNSVETRLIRLVDSPTGKQNEQIFDQDLYGVPEIAMGERIIFQFANRHPEQNIYVTLVALGTSGKVDVLWPPTGGAQALPPGGTVKSPVIKVGGPLGMETYKILLTTKPTDFSFLEVEGPKRGDTRNDLNSLRLLMARNGIGMPTRDPEVEDAAPIDSWATQAKEIKVIAESKTKELTPISKEIKKTTEAKDE